MDSNYASLGGLYLMLIHMMYTKDTFYEQIQIHFMKMYQIFLKIMYFYNFSLFLCNDRSFSELQHSLYHH